MAIYEVDLLHGKRQGEGKCKFEGPDDLMSRTLVKAMRAFMAYLEDKAHLGHIEYEINVAMKNKQAQVVIVLGEFEVAENNTQPFVCMISPKA